MAGLNQGYKYTVSRTGKLPSIGIQKTHPIDVHDTKTGKIIHCSSVLEAVTKTGVPETTIYYHCKKNKNKYQDEWTSYKNYIFISAKKPIF